MEFERPDVKDELEAFYSIRPEADRLSHGIGQFDVFMSDPARREELRTSLRCDGHRV
jgi:hypothetical protein